MSKIDFLLKLPVCSNTQINNCISLNDYEELKKIQTQLNTNKEKYENMNMKYNLEMWNIINNVGGIGLLLLYIYYNK